MEAMRLLLEHGADVDANNTVRERERERAGDGVVYQLAHTDPLGAVFRPENGGRREHPSTG